MTRRAIRSSRGAETIEVALTLPIVIAIIFCGMEYGWAMVRTVQVDHAARVGAREASLSGVTAGDVEARVRDALDKAGISDASVTVTPPDLASVPPGTVVKVDIEVPYAKVGLVRLGRLMPIPSTLRGHASMVREPGS